MNKHSRSRYLTEIEISAVGILAFGLGYFYSRYETRMHTEINLIYEDKIGKQGLEGIITESLDGTRREFIEIEKGVYRPYNQNYI